jgi:ABC-type antimicrobial peptide transport system permease subunit
MRAALGRPLVVLLSGSAAGLVLGVLASRLLAALVYEATPRDPLVLIGAVAAMVVIGVIATWIPARRALAINPAQLLRQE